MAKNDLSADWIIKNGQKLKIAYGYVVVNKYNVKSKNDVIKILRIIDPENANEEHAGLFSKMLQLFGRRFRKTIEEGLKD